MSTEQLKESLKKLHDSINESVKSADQIDAELSDLLTDLNEDIHQLLSKERPDEDALSNLGERTLSLSAKFAAQNPRLELGLRELADALARMGI
jgi:Mg2+ and Co2+ transporter CorA